MQNALELKKELKKGRAKEGRGTFILARNWDQKDMIFVPGDARMSSTAAPSFAV
jgi:hypothetical protein